MGDIFNHLGQKKEPGYIVEDIKHPDNLGGKKKRFCIKAIYWLLTKTSHSIQEIADHFEISPELVDIFVTELIADQRVVKLTDDGRYLSAKECIKRNLEFRSPN